MKDSFDENTMKFKRIFPDITSPIEDEMDKAFYGVLVGISNFSKKMNELNQKDISDIESQGNMFFSGTYHLISFMSKRYSLSEDIIKQNISKLLKNKMLEAKHMNWGLKFDSEYSWCETHWSIDHNGLVVYYIVFTDRSYSQPYICQLELEEIDQLKKHINAAIGKHQEAECCDGDGWGIVSYNEQGTENGSFWGYIYDIPELELLSEFLYSIINKHIKNRSINKIDSNTISTYNTIIEDISKQQKSTQKSVLE